jgi:Na+-driven multidrug efflux pump
VFNQAIWTNLIMFMLMTIPLFLCAEHILIFANIDPVVAARCQQIMYYMLLADALELAGDTTRVFCMAQGFEEVFGSTSILALIVSVIFGYIFVVRFELGAIGWVFSKCLYEGILLLIALATTLMTHPDTRGFASFSIVREGYGVFFWDAIKYSLGSYSEFIGYEVASYFVFLTHDIPQIAAYTAVMNFTSLFYSIGETFAIICRTRMNLLIGKELKRTAKNFYIFFMLVLFTMGTLAGVFFYLVRKQVTSAYAESNFYMSEAFEKLFIVYCFCIPSELSIPTTFMGIKTVGGINCLLALNFLLFICGNFVQSYYFSVVKHWGSLPIFIGLQVLFYIENFLCISRVLFTDWAKCELLIEDEPSGEALLAEDLNPEGPKIVNPNLVE